MTSTPRKSRTEPKTRVAVLAERRATFVADALAARADMLGNGLGYEADEVHAWLRGRMTGQRVRKLQPAAWRT